MPAGPLPRLTASRGPGPRFAVYIPFRDAPKQIVKPHAARLDGHRYQPALRDRDVHNRPYCDADILGEGLGGLPTCIYEDGTGRAH